MTDWTFDEKRYAGHESVIDFTDEATRARSRLYADAPRLLSALVEARAEVERLRRLMSHMVSNHEASAMFKAAWVEARKIAEGVNHE